MVKRVARILKWGGTTLEYSNQLPRSDRIFSPTPYPLGYLLHKKSVSRRRIIEVLVPWRPYWNSWFGTRRIAYSELVIFQKVDLIDWNTHVRYKLSEISFDIDTAVLILTTYIPVLFMCLISK